MVHIRGRQPTGLNQPPGGGTNYPFLNPTADIKYLLGDLFVSFDDLKDQIVYPLRVAWLYGFGVNAVAAPAGYPTPAHSHDILIVDANDVVVFDSTVAAVFSTDVWDDRLLILEWTTDQRILRCTMHTDWTQADIDDGLTVEYDDYIVPEDGILQGDTWFKLPKRVTSLQVGLETISQVSEVQLSEGYNIALGHGDDLLFAPNLNLPTFGNQKTLSPGTRLTSRIQLTAEPGAGLGVFPGCGEQELVLKTINRVRSNTYQNFTYDSEGCLRTQRPIGLLTESPREFDYASFQLSSEQSAAAIEMSNDCRNCCDCEYFARTYQGIKRQWFLHQDIATLAEETRDTYYNNTVRWEIQKAIRETDTLRLRVAVDGNCKISWGLSHCNASKCCISGVTIQLTWLYYVNGMLMSPTEMGFDCNKSKIQGSAQCDGPEPLVLAWEPSGRSASAFWDYSDPQSITTLQGRHCFPDCVNLESEALKIRLHAVVSWDTAINPETEEVCEDFPLLVESDYPADVLATWAAVGTPIPPAGRAQKLTPLDAVSDHNPFCERCPCGGDDHPGPEISEDTYIYIWLDSSGSMNNSLAPLRVMRDTLFKDALLKFYNNDSARYDSHVSIIEYRDERTLDVIHRKPGGEPDYPIEASNVISIVFQDESSPYNDFKSMTSRFTSDMIALRAELDQFPADFFKGIFFQVDYSDWKGGLITDFREGLRKIQNGTPPFDKQYGLAGYRNEFAFKYGITDGGTPTYYLDQVVEAIRQLGFKV